MVVNAFVTRSLALFLSMLHRVVLLRSAINLLNWLKVTFVWFLNTVFEPLLFIEKISSHTYECK